MQNDQNVEKYLRIGMFGDTQGRLGTKCIELGNRCSIRLSYGTGKDNFAPALVRERCVRIARPDGHDSSRTSAFGAQSWPAVREVLRAASCHALATTREA